MTQSVSSNDQTSISFTTSGEGKKTVLLLHGWMVSGAVYNGLINALPSDDYTFVAINFRGTGASSAAKDGYSLDRYVEDVEAVHQTLNGAVHVIGHSMGGQVAQLFAARNPSAVASLTLISPVPVSGVPLPPELVDMFSNSGQSRDAQGQILGMACLDISDSDRETLLDDAGAIDKDVIAQSFASWAAGGDSTELGNITANTLVIGSDDPFLPPEFLTAAVIDPIANASHQHISGAGHYIQIERLDECASAVSAFLSEN